LNGKIVGEKQIRDSLSRQNLKCLMSGELKAVAIENGKEVGNVILKTTNAPKTILLKADRSTIQATGMISLMSLLKLWTIRTMLFRMQLSRLNFQSVGQGSWQR
jgi:hypothetical protein